MFLPSTARHLTSRPQVLGRIGSLHGAWGTHSWKTNGWERGRGQQDSRLTVPKNESLLKKAELCEATPGADSYWVPAAYPAMRTSGGSSGFAVETVVECRNWGTA